MFLYETSQAPGEEAHPSSVARTPAASLKLRINTGAIMVKYNCLHNIDSFYGAQVPETQGAVRRLDFGRKLRALSISC